MAAPQYLFHSLPSTCRFWSCFVVLVVSSMQRKEGACRHLKQMLADQLGCHDVQGMSPTQPCLWYHGSEKLWNDGLFGCRREW